MAPNRYDNCEQNETTPIVSGKKRTVKVASRRRKGVVCAACVVLYMIASGLGYGLSVMYVEIIRIFNASRSTTVLVQSLFMAICSAGGIVWAPVIRRYGPAQCAFAGCIIACIGFFASSFSKSTEMIIVSTGLVASFGMSVCYLVPFITASALFREDAGEVLIFVATCASIGQSIFPYIYEILISNYGWNGAFILLGGLALQCAPASCILYGSRDYQAESGGLQNRRTGCAAMSYCDWRLLTTGVFLILLSSSFVLASTANLEGWFLVDMMTIIGYERKTGSMFLSILGLFIFLGRSTGVLLRFKARIPAIYHWIYCMPILAISHLLVLQFTAYWPLLLASVLYGYVFGIVISQISVIGLDVVGLERYPEGMAFLNMFYGLGILFGENIGGIIKDSYGSYAPLFYFAICASLYIALSSVLMVVILRRRTNTVLDEDLTISYKRLKSEG